jgi:hypothetical protein
MITNDSLVKLIQWLNNIYYKPMREAITQHPQLQQSVSPFLVWPEEITIYVGEEHIALEYSWNETTSLEDNVANDIKIKVIDLENYESSFIEWILWFDIKSTVKWIKIPLPSEFQNGVLHSNKWMDKLLEIWWDFLCRDAPFTFFNWWGYEIEKKQFSRRINFFAFHEVEWNLITRYIKWIDFIPYKNIATDKKKDAISIDLSIYQNLREGDVQFVFPTPKLTDYKKYKLPQLNRFTEMVYNSSYSEVQLTQFLSKKENQFILWMYFNSQEVFPEKKCYWQSEERQAIIPDFFVKGTDWFSDIVELKLPSLKHNSVVGKVNRETFSAEMHSYIAQTRVYEEFFEDINNRRRVEATHWIKTYKPVRHLIVWREKSFKTEDLKTLTADFKNINIIQYSNLIDTVRWIIYKYN